MAAQLKASEVEKAIRALITAERTNLGIEVTVPVAYGDGELASVVVENNGDSFRVHDAGFSAMRLTGAGVAVWCIGLTSIASDITARFPMVECPLPPR